MKGSKLRILDYLKIYGSITSVEAFRLFGITRLAARIKELRDKGYLIDTVMLNGVNRYGEDVRFAKYVWKGNNNESIGD